MLLGGITVLSALFCVVICAATDAFDGLQWLWLLPVSFLGSFLVLVAGAFAFLWVLCRRVDLDVPQEQDSPFYRKMISLYADAIVTILQMRVHTVGLDRTPGNGRFMLVCNHLHILDPVLLLVFFKQNQLAFISKQENEGMFLVGKLMYKIMCQPINRENDREALKTILKCIQLIKEDQVSIGVFPEGYTSRDGKLQSFRSGVFKIAQKANVPVVVCTIQNTQKVFHNAKRLKPTDVELHLVGIIPPEELKGQTAVDIGDRVYQMMLDDLGPDYLPEGRGQ